MIKAIHYFAVGLLILAFAHDIKVFYNISAGLVLGLGIGYWVQWHMEQKELKENMHEFEERLKKVNDLHENFLKKHYENYNIPEEK